MIAKIPNKLIISLITMEINMENKSGRVLGYSLATLIDKDRLAEVSGGATAAGVGKVSCERSYYLTGTWRTDASIDCS